MNFQLKRVYKAFGLNISSEIPLPELRELPDQDVPIDVVIEVADLTKEWERWVSEEQQLVVRDNGVMIQVDQAAVFIVQEGKRILVSPKKNYDENKLRLFLLGSCMGALLIQRAVLPLHGSAIDIEGRAFAFVGRSGAGKSTLAAAFLQRGYRLLTDDVIPVSLSRDDIPYVTPAYPQQKLWQDSLNNLGMDSKDYLPIIQKLTKYAIPVPHLFSEHTVPLAGIIEIVNSDDEVSGLYRVEDMVRLQTLYTHTYRSKLLQPLGLMEWHFNQIIKLAGSVEMFRLVRPTSGVTPSDMISLILNSIQREAVR